MTVFATKRTFIEKDKNRATIEADFVVNRGKDKPILASKLEEHARRVPFASGKQGQSSDAYAS